MERTVTTTGSGAAAATPDAVQVSLTVRVQAPSVPEALSATAGGVARAGEVARRFTDDGRVSSRGLSLWPARDSTGAPVGYEAAHALEVRCAGLDRGGELVTALGHEVGEALQIDGVALVVDDTGPLEPRARRAAFEDARSRAAELAALAGASLGPVVEVVEGSAARPPGGVRLAGAESFGTSFEPGSTEVGATVTVTWRLEG